MPNPDLLALADRVEGAMRHAKMRNRTFPVELHLADVEALVACLRAHAAKGEG